ncbi:MAG: type IIL restriction-modification enzyme MmeI, partial [Candidatus Puniceispirillaceae bacterium]
MRLTWREMKHRAAAFAESWQGQGYEKGQTQLFYQEFFQIFDVPVRRIATFEEPVRRTADQRGFIDLFWKG